MCLCWWYKDSPVKLEVRSQRRVVTANTDGVARNTWQPGGAGRCPRCVRLWAGVVPFGWTHFSSASCPQNHS